MKEKAIPVDFPWMEKLYIIEDVPVGVCKKCGEELPKELQKKETRVKKIEEALKRLQEEDKEKINVTDNEAHFMQERHSVIKPSYNCKIATTPDQVIVAYDAVCEAADIKQLQPIHLLFLFFLMTSLKLAYGWKI